MVFRFRGQCFACGHEWNGLRRRIKCGRIDLEEPESYRCYSCPRCAVELYVPRQASRSAWLRWVSQNASEMTRSPLHFCACEVGVTIDWQALEVISRSVSLFRVCERISSNLAGTGSRYQYAPIDIGAMNCADCGEPLNDGELNAELVVCPECKCRSVTWASEIVPALVLVDYSPLAADDVRRVVQHIEQLAEPPKGRFSKRLLALPASESAGPLWDRLLDG
jgi:hypothetical protein